MPQKEFSRVCTELDSGEISRLAQSLARNGDHEGSLSCVHPGGPVVKFLPAGDQSIL